MADGTKRTIKDWLEVKKMTPDQLMRAGAGINVDVIRRWTQTGKMPLEAEKSGLHVAGALGIAPELLDLGPYRRGMSEPPHRFVLYAYRDGPGWKAYIGAWGFPKRRRNVTPRVLSRRFGDLSARVSGATRETALDGLESELRALIRANPEEDEAE